jgi:hypothetical protein
VEIDFTNFGVFLILFRTLAQNLFGGFIPDFLESITELQTLNLKGNKLQGPIPGWRLPKLKML